MIRLGEIMRYPSLVPQKTHGFAVSFRGVVSMLVFAEELPQDYRAPLVHAQVLIHACNVFGLSKEVKHIILPDLNHWIDLSDVFVTAFDGQYSNTVD